jgi:DNA-binding MarR family transcriptional regulator/catechol 2,3-dioxygenase-like lactoylglutathione lyase family enzyme
MTAAPFDTEAAMGTAPPDDTPIPTLMRRARGAYAQAIRAELQAMGTDDLPRNGAGILFSALAPDADAGQRGPSLSDQLGITKQAVSQLIQNLVQRGFVVRRDDPGDGRRVGLELTERGHEIVHAVVRAVDSVDGELAAAVSPAEVEAFRKALTALARIKTERVRHGTSTRRPPRTEGRFEPIFPVRDLRASLAHYEGLGFTTSSHDAGYGFARWGGSSIHLAAEPGRTSASQGAAAYLQVPDADTVHAAWSTPGLGGVTHPVEDTPWGVREGSHTDPDGNVIRFGSPRPR